MKITALIGAAFAALFISGCANDQAFVKAQADAATAASNARVAEAQAAEAEAKAIIALSSKASPGGADAALLVRSLKGLGLGSQQVRQDARVERPRDWIDYLNAGTQFVAAIGTVAVPIVTVKESNKTQRYLAEQNVNLEGVRQTGESTRFAAATGSLERLGTAGVQADRGAHTTTTINAGGDVANNGSSIARLTCEASGGAWTPTVPATAGAITTPPALSGSAGAGTCTQR